MKDFLTEAARFVARSPIPYVNGPGRSYGMGSGRLSKRDQLAMMENNSTLFSIVNKFASLTASVEWHMHRAKKGAVCQCCEATEVEQVTTHPALVVLKKPNPFFTQQETFEAGQQHIDLAGEGWTVMSRLGKVPMELWVARPDRIEVVTSPTEFLTGYIYHGPSGEEVPIPREDMLSIRLPNPMDPHRGLSPVSTITDNLLSAQYSARWNRAFFQNGARPAGVVQFKENRIMTDTQWKTFKQRWDENHRGISKSNNVAFLEGGAEWKDVQFSQKDMMFTDLAQLDKSTIREAYGAPKFLTGDVEDVNRATAEASKAWIAEGSTVPRLDRWKGMLNNDFLPQFPGYDPNLSFVYTSPVPADREADREDKKAAAQIYKELRDAGVDPEDAAKVAGLPPMKTVSPSQPGGSDFQAQLKEALV